MLHKSTNLVLFTCLICGWLAFPALGQAAGRDARFKEYRQKLAKDLKLSADQEKEYNTLGDQFLKQRMDLYAELEKGMADLKQAMAAKPLDEANIKTAVETVTAVKDKLWVNYQDWWRNEMKLLNPVQQGQYLMTLDTWWKNVMAGHGGMKHGKKQ